MTILIPASPPPPTPTPPIPTVIVFPVPKGYLNQFIYMAKTVPMLKPLAKLPPWQGQLAFAVLQNIMTLIMILPTYLLYRTFWLHFILICLIISACIWNGGNFYVEVFARKYKGWTKKDIMKVRPAVSLMMRGCGDLVALLELTHSRCPLSPFQVS